MHHLHSHKLHVHVSTCTYLATTSDEELFEGANVIYEEAHESQLLTEPHQDKETTGV